MKNEIKWVRMKKCYFSLFLYTSGFFANQFAKEIDKMAKTGEINIVKSAGHECK